MLFRVKKFLHPRDPVCATKFDASLQLNLMLSAGADSTPPSYAFHHSMNGAPVVGSEIQGYCPELASHQASCRFSYFRRPGAPLLSVVRRHDRVAVTARRFCRRRHSARRRSCWGSLPRPLQRRAPLGLPPLPG